MFWLSYELSLEREVLRERHRLELRKMTHEQLLSAADLLCQDWHQNKYLLNQHVVRVAELECKLALLEPIDEKYEQWASELLAELQPDQAVPPPQAD